MSTPHKPPPEWAVRTAADRKALADGYYWDHDQAERIVRFAHKYLVPRFTAGEFELIGWQRRFIMSLYGWRHPTGRRRFNRALLHVPKKNGKTLLVSILAAYELLAAPVAFPLVMSGSTSRKNARQVYEQIQTAVKRSPKLRALCQFTDSARLIKVATRDGEFHAISSDAPSAEGENLSLGIVDEAHAHRSPRLYRTLEYSTIGREDGLLVVISTAGDDLTSYYYGLVERGRRVLAGEDLDPTFYAEVYEARPTEDLEDPALWKRCNPSLDEYPGYTSERFMLDLLAAKQNTGDWLSFQRYRLNVFQQSEDGGWVDLVAWDKCKGAVPDAELLAAPCWLGFDASQRVDPTSLAGVWLLPGPRFYAKSWAWVAEAGVREREKSNLPRYQQFAAEGSMTITPGDVIEKEPIRAKILALRAAGHQVRAMVMDPNGAWVFGTEIAGEGIEVFRQPQNFKHFNDPTKAFEEAVTAGRVVHDGGTWLRWCVNSVRLDVDSYGNVRPVKRKSADHIDGAIAVLMAFALANRASAEVKPKRSVYEGRGFRTLAGGAT